MWLPLVAQTLSASALQVTQVTSIVELRGVSSTEAFDLVATPTNWADLAVASHRVSGQSTTSMATRLQAGDRVEELAGAPRSCRSSLIGPARSPTQRQAS